VRSGAGWDRSVVGVVRRTYQAVLEDNVAFLASALSFDLLLAAIPFVVLLLGFVGYLVQHQIATEQIDVQQLLQRFLPPTTHAEGRVSFVQLEALFLDVVENRGRLTLIGMPLFLWFSTRLFGSLRAALNEVFDTEERRPWLAATALDASMMVATGSLLLANGLLSAGVSYLEAWSEGTLGRFVSLHWFWALSLELLAFLFGVALFFLLFKVLPSRRIVWRTALIAATFCAVAFEIAKRLYALYLTEFATLDQLGSNANVVAFVLFLLWLHYSTFVFLLGGEVAEMYDLIQRRRSQRVQLG
jgi:membrane protein